jgi:hypothetical protein
MKESKMDKNKKLQRANLKKAIMKVLDEASEVGGGGDPLQFSDDPMKTAELMKVTGHATPAGARQYANVLLQQVLKDLNPLVNNEEYEELRYYAQNEYLRLMQIDRASDGQPRLSAEDVKELKANRLELDQLPSFQYFFNAAFYHHPYELWNSAQLKSIQINKVFNELGLVPEMKQTVWNQVWGYAKFNVNRLKARIESFYPDPAVAAKVFSNLMKRWEEMTNIIEKTHGVKNGEDLVDKVFKTYKSTPEADKLKLIQQAVKLTQEDISGQTRYI